MEDNVAVVAGPSTPKNGRVVVLNKVYSLKRLTPVQKSLVELKAGDSGAFSSPQVALEPQAGLKIVLDPQPESGLKTDTTPDVRPEIDCGRQDDEVRRKGAEETIVATPSTSESCSCECWSAPQEKKRKVEENDEGENLIKLSKEQLIEMIRVSKASRSNCQCLGKCMRVENKVETYAEKYKQLARVALCLNEKINARNAKIAALTKQLATKVRPKIGMHLKVPTLQTTAQPSLAPRSTGFAYPVNGHQDHPLALVPTTNKEPQNGPPQNGRPNGSFVSYGNPGQAAPQQRPQQRLQALLAGAPMLQKSSPMPAIPNGPLPGRKKFNNVVHHKNSNAAPLLSLSYEVLNANTKYPGVRLLWNNVSTSNPSLAPKTKKYKLFVSMQQKGVNLEPMEDIQAMPLPMTCMLTNLTQKCTYTFAICAIDENGQISPFSNFCEIAL